MLRRTFEPAGIVTISVFTHEIREGSVDLEHFLSQHDPHVVVYDLAPPYDANWRLFQHLRRMPGLRQRPIVITSTNAAHVEGFLDASDKVYEVVGKPYDLDQIVRAVKEAARWRPAR